MHGRTIETWNNVQITGDSAELQLPRKAAHFLFFVTYVTDFFQESLYDFYKETIKHLTPLNRLSYLP